jgi:hypothetical protein
LFISNSIPPISSNPTKTQSFFLQNMQKKPFINGDSLSQLQGREKSERQQKFIAATRMNILPQRGVRMNL